MSRVIHYRYLEVGPVLIDALHAHIERNENFVLLGCQGSGKRQAFNKLCVIMREEDRPHLTIWFRDTSEIITAQELLQALRSCLKHFRCEEIVANLNEAVSVDDWFQRFGESSKGSSLPVCFANIDTLAAPIKDRFLACIRDATQQRHLVACLSGDSVLARTLGRDTLPWYCPFQYIITSHDKATAHEFFDKRVSSCQLDFHDPSDPGWNAHQAFEALYEHTGGNLNLLRAILWWLSERRLRFDQKANMHPGFPREIIKQSFFAYTAIPLFGLRIFHTVVAFIRQEREALALLEKLLDQVHAKRADGADLRTACLEASTPVVRGDRPDALELAGFIRRDSGNKQLSFPSFYVAEFAYEYFSWVRRGDFHAIQGDWDKAFASYRQVKPKVKLVRPLGDHDYQNVRSIVNRFCRECAESITHVDATKRLRWLGKECGELLFGMRSVLLLRLGEDGIWVAEPGGEELRADLKPVLDALLASDPVPSTRKNREDKTYGMHQDDNCRFLLVQNRPGTPEVKPRHAILLESEEDGSAIDGLRLKLLETAATTFLTCYNEARLRNRLGESRLRLGKALKALFQHTTIRESLEALGKYLHEEFLATGVRLFLLDPKTGDLYSAKSWGLKDAAVRADFDSGKIRLLVGEHSEFWRALLEKRPVAFRWCPPHEELPHLATDMEFRPVRDGAYAHDVERQPGDYWIDFPLHVGEQRYGQLTLAFSAHAPPSSRQQDDLCTISEILSQHLERLQVDEVRIAEMRMIQTRAVSVMAHDLATRISSLPIFLADYERLKDELEGDTLAELSRINEKFRARLKSSMNMLEQAKLRLGEVKPNYSQIDLRKIIEDALETVDLETGAARAKLELVGADPQERIMMQGDQDHLTAVFFELVSDSMTMRLPSRALEVRVRLKLDAAAGKILIDYVDNGPGVPVELKDMIFKYLVSFRPGQKRKGLGLGLGYVQETIQAHAGTIKEIGVPGEGVHFYIEIPVEAPNP